MDYTISRTGTGATIAALMLAAVSGTNVGEDRELVEAAARDVEAAASANPDRVVSVTLTGDGSGNRSRFRREITVSPLQKDARTGARATVDDGTNRVQNPPGDAVGDARGGAAVVGRGSAGGAGGAGAAAAGAVPTTFAGGAAGVGGV